jgi:hypothetical protein
LKASPRIVALSIFVLLSLSVLASAETLSGTVKNGTTGKPAVGDDVVLLKLGQGMEEGGRTKTDSKGNFSFTLDDQGPHLIRAIHQGATYHSMAPPGSTSVEVEVYDVAKKVDGLSVTADVMRFQAQGNELQVIRLFAVDNQSKPPLTQMNDQNFEFYLPDGASVDTGLAMTAGGKPITSAPVPQKEKNRYSFLFPLRPGTTQFQVVFHMSYSGELSLDPKPLYPAQHFVVVLPKTMQFSATGGAGFQSMQDPNEADAVVQVASNTQVGQPLAFKISGTGTLAESGGDQVGGPQTSGGGGGGAQTSRPGGGLGPPIDAPDPLEKYQLWILAGFVAALVIGGIYIVRRSKSLPAPDYAASDVDLPAAPAPPSLSKPAPTSRSGLLLEALKEEMFELELEHKQGRISQQEYEKARAALDQTLSRAVKRETAKT